MSENIQPSILLKADVNGYLNLNADTLDAAFTLTPTGFDMAQAPRLEQNVIFMGDVSGSMDSPASKLKFMKLAMIGAIRKLPEHFYFAVVTFASSARAVVELCQATEANKKLAIAAVERITAGGGTEMSKGLKVVMQEQMRRPQAAGLCVLLTDGQNDGSDEGPLEEVLRDFQSKAGQGMVVQVHARGVYSDFSFDQVNKIATATKGMAPEYIEEADKLEADFAALVDLASANVISDVRLNVWTPKVVSIKACKKTLPFLQDLMGSQTVDQTAGITSSFPLGAMNAEVTEYFVTFALQPKPVGQAGSAGKVWVSFMYNGTKVETAPETIRCEWTGDHDTRSIRIPEGVARARGDVDFARNIQEGMEALKNGDKAAATQRLGAAAKFAHEKGDKELTQRLEALVVIEDAAAGTVKIKAGAEKDTNATLRLESASIRTKKLPVNAGGK
ncbi:MAG TPA: VWA domain-containing protein [Candidatus Obscuribacter sp.]|nr:VWA domain-containing protein [Candidatus Obscuribacter sp.]HNM50527.1 VWA domain-containing protein [Candidatus Obscuribacter sp.]